MDKTVIFSVAGSGKTTHIINRLDKEKRSIIVTYTNNNYCNLRTKIIQKFGCVPKNITLFTYYSFLYSFCFKPFCNQLKTKGINYKDQPNKYVKNNNDRYYIDSNNRLYSSRISKRLIQPDVLNDIKERIAEYFDNLFIDEVQDFAGNDFNFLKEIVKAEINILFVGDFYQHTYDTSRDGNTNKNLHTDLQEYQKKFESAGLKIDTTSLNKSWRCSPTVCTYISENLGIQIESHRTEGTEIIIIDSKKESLNVFENPKIVKLFYKESYNYDCFSNNWGNSKGEDKYNDVCVVMNKTTYEKYQQEKLRELAPQTKNKFYVALSRTKNNLYLVSEGLLKTSFRKP